MPSIATDLLDSPLNGSSRNSFNELKTFKKSSLLAQNTQKDLNDQNNLDLITGCIDSFLQIDSIFPRLTEQLRVSPGFIFVSGRRDVDYPNLEEYGTSLKNLSQFIGLKTIPLPKILIEQFGQMVQRCEMGIFSDIKRAWLAIDTNVYLWKYDTGSDVAYYDALSRMILKVDLTKPKKGVFKPHIKYILVLVTFTEIIMLGITFSDVDNLDDMGDLLVIPEPIYTISTDNVEIKTIKSTESGRIFLGGCDGCLYEICYQADTSWFGSNCRKVNHSNSAFSFLIPKLLQSSKQVPIIQIEIDEVRQILYTLNEEGDIGVFDIIKDTSSKVICKSLISISREAIHAASSIDEINFKSIVSIDVVEESESIHVNLIAITKTGARLYFTATNLNSPEQRPSCLNLIHIRLPPGFAASSISNRPNDVQMTHYKKGNFVFLSFQNDNKDILWVLSSDSFAFKNELSELYTIIPLKTRIWCMAEEPNVIDYKPYQSLSFKNKTFALETPSIVTQHLESPKKFIFLTTQGVIIGYKPRLIDQLKQLLLENQGYENEAVKSFFKLHDSSFQSNACVFALILACDQYPTGEEKLVEWATSAFFHYGNEIFDQTHHNNLMPIISTPIASNTAKDQLSTSLVGSPIRNDSFKMSPISSNVLDGTRSQQTFMDVHQSQSTPYVNTNYPLSNYSNKCRALFIYFSRIIRPIWNLKTVNFCISQTEDGTKEILASNITADEIKVYLLRLNALQNFLKQNTNFSLLESERYLKSTFPRLDQQTSEKNLIYGLLKLVEHCLEVLNLWKLLCVHQFHVIVSNIAKDKQAQLSNMNFKDLIVFGSDMTTLLASALVQRFIEDHSTTDIINKRLQDVCPSIYKNENALHAKVHEMVLKAKSLTNENDRKILLENALKICKKIGPRINLQAICDLFQIVKWYEAIVDICLTTAQQRDPQNLASHYRKNKDRMLEDPQGKDYYDSRMECYLLLLDIYGRLIQHSKSILNSRTTTLSDNLSPEEAKNFAQTVLRLSIQSNDEIFHYNLYHWLYEHNQTDKLLEIKSPYLEAYLKEKTTEINDSLLMDFLWLYYERNGHYSAAAQILAKLAEKNSNELSLQKRIEYLSRAIVCMKSLDARMISSSIGVIGSAGEFLHVLEEKIEVARIQQQILNCIEKNRPVMFDEAIQALNSSLLNITALYQEFAVPFELYECQLKILHCADHEDVTLIENIWRSILNQELSSVADKDIETQKTLLKNKIKELGIAYLNTEKFFPLELIITLLECNVKFSENEPNWLVETFLSLKIPLIYLFEIYHKIYKSRVDFKTPGLALNPLNLLKSLVYLINQLDHCYLNPSDRKYFVSKALDLISGYISDLLFDSSDSETKEMLPI
ncbi:Nuclear pore complex protein [Sarcoptes scabiei]|uniref:Nuclear pore complex protein n=1 Tax=Sarcoptes scabiei TaxID=52283 RepID=A0A834RCZ6_SARSC|nr:Nuclear pore complex protein [Sarcoptes scabiei]